MALYTDLNIDLTDEQIAIKEETHRFAKEVLRPASLELDKYHDPAEMMNSDLFRNAFKKGYELGYHTIFIPDTWGGLGTDPLETHIVLEELAWGSVDFAIGIGVSCFPAFFATMVPNDKLAEEIIEPFCANEDASIIGCWAITEPEHGTDTLCPYTPEFENPAISGQLTARLDGDAYIIEGQKSAWVSNGTIATHALAYLTIDPSMGMAGGGICVVPLDLPGVRKGRPLDKMGQRALNQGEIFFDKVRVPREYMLVDPESYSAMLDITLSTANAAMGAMFTGVGPGGLRRSPAICQTARAGRPAPFRAPADQAQAVRHVHQDRSGSRLVSGGYDLQLQQHPAQCGILHRLQSLLHPDRLRGRQRGHSDLRRQRSGAGVPGGEVFPGCPGRDDRGRGQRQPDDHGRPSSVILAAKTV